MRSQLATAASRWETETTVRPLPSRRRVWLMAASVSIQNLFLFAAAPATVAVVALVTLGVSISRQNAMLARAMTPFP